MKTEKITINLTREQLRDVAEMAALSLTLVEVCRDELNPARVAGWESVCKLIMEYASNIPALKKRMEVNSDMGHWFFRESFARDAFYAQVLDAARDALFWSDLVTRMADNALSESMSDEEFQTLDDEEKARRTSALEEALKEEVANHGLDRFAFYVPSDES